MGVIAKGILRGCQVLFTPCPWDTHYQFSIKKTLLSRYTRLMSSSHDDPVCRQFDSQVDEP